MPIFKTKIKTEAFAAVTAIIVSACALGVSFYEVRIMRAQQKSMVWPHVLMGQQYDGDGFALEAYNKGVGPAMVESLKLWVDNKPMNSLNQVLDTILGEGHGIDWNNYSIHNVNGNVLESGYELPMVRFSWNDQTRKLQKRLGRIRIEMIYKSIYDDCWKVTFGTNPEPCDCPAEKIASEQFSF
ncbi:hypothetical protein BFP97_02835 [Roseivirga sp. 4D4]|uniref:hypothetical protein n=1 Tax=Roseivirga sp. 4D4 TaxID=1889784 RepID=UPI000852AF90|nr:hypothetical protein [Roseivirga sp. 4D4]OEK00508.1 hypothetical protein BFP97_02835 [Roseivirga sp. 4D4]